MSDADRHTRRIEQQFTRQADAYCDMEQTKDQASLDLLVTLSGVDESARVLDVACGPGFLTMTFGAKCAEATGVDATPAFVEAANAEAMRRRLANTTFREGRADRLELPDDEFDLVTCRAAFHHFVNPETVLSEMKRVARPGGALLIADMIASEDPSERALHDRIEILCDPTHTRVLLANEFEALFATHGLALELGPRSELAYDVEEWISHGGPTEADAAEIRRLLRGSMDGDAAGLAVHEEEGRLRFRHNVAVYRLRVPA